MRDLLEIVLSNAAIATVLALLAMIVGRYCRRPAVVYGCWLLVLLKLATPSLVRVPISLFAWEPIAEPAIASPRNEAPQLNSHTAGTSEVVNSDLQTDLVESREVVQQNQAEWKPDNSGSSMGSPSSFQSMDSSDRAATRKAADGRRSPSSRKRGNEGSAAPALSRSADHHVPWEEWALGLWAAGSTVYFSIVMWRLLRFSREIGRLGSVDDDLRRQSDSLAQRFGLARSPTVKLVNAPVPPMLWAMRRPATVVLPRALMARLSPQQQNALLAHELAHYCRHDHWVRWFEVVILGLYWWHPVAWLARRELQRAEEQCCDAWVLWALPDAGKAYARALLETVDFLTADCRPAPALASGLGPVHLLERRLEMILHAHPTRGLSAFAKLILMLLGLVVLPISASAQVATEPVQPASDSQAKTPPALPTVDNTQPAEVRSVDPAFPVADKLPVNRDPRNVAATSLALTNGDVQDQTERRLSRLEKMMERIMSELPNQRVSERFPLPPAGGFPSAQNRFDSRAMSGMGTVAARPVSLSDLKKERIDVEDELQKLQDHLARLDEQIAKMQSVRSTKELGQEKPQLK